jgi:hypothetical protein
MKPDYQVILNPHDQALLEKFGNKTAYESDQRYRLSILVDIYNGQYQPELHNTDLAKQYSQVLVAFCHFDGKWIPQGKFRWNPPEMRSNNVELDNGKQYETISESITTLLHGNEALAREICDHIDLFDKYKKEAFEQEKAIINRCFMKEKTFDVSKYIPEHQYHSTISLLSKKQ